MNVNRQLARGKPAEIVSDMPSSQDGSMLTTAFPSHPSVDELDRREVIAFTQLHPPEESEAIWSDVVVGVELPEQPRTTIDGQSGVRHFATVDPLGLPAFIRPNSCTMSSTRSLASPNSIRALSRKNSGFCTPA